MTSQPKVSIITCFLNVAPFLGAAVNSVLQQTYPAWELLLIDDGSTDGSTELAKEFAARHPGRIIYLEHEAHANRGSSASRNAGLQAATGELVTFLDADDLYDPDYLECQVALIREKKVAMVCEATNYWYSWNSSYKDIIVPVGAPQNQTFHPPQLMLHLYPLGNGAAPCICGMLIKKAAINEHGGFDASFRGMYDEQVLLAKLYLNEPVYVSAACHNHYRQRSNSLVGVSKTNKTEYLQVRKAFLEWLEQYLAASGQQHEQVNLALKRAFMPYRQPALYFFTGTLPRLAKALGRRATRILDRLRSASRNKPVQQQPLSNN